MIGGGEADFSSPAKKARTWALDTCAGWVFVFDMGNFYISKAIIVIISPRLVLTTGTMNGCQDLSCWSTPGNSESDSEAATAIKGLDILSGSRFGATWSPCSGPGPGTGHLFRKGTFDHTQLHIAHNSPKTCSVVFAYPSKYKHTRGHGVDVRI